MKTTNFPALLQAMNSRPALNLATAEPVEDVQKENSRLRLLRDPETDRRYCQQMQDGAVTVCFEILLSWQPWPSVDVYEFTPDGRHVWQLEHRKADRRISANPLSLAENLIAPGDCCTHRGITVEFLGEGEIAVNGRPVPVVENSAYTYRFLRREMQAAGGARGFYRFLEHIAYQAAHGLWPLFSDVFTLLAEKYPPVTPQFAPEKQKGATL